MVVYHGAIRQITKPQMVEIEIGRDFGIAFYTTDTKTQAERWAVRKAKIINCRQGEDYVPTVNAYEWDEAAGHLSIKRFPDLSGEWLDMVVMWRSTPKRTHPYDIVIGKIADDNVGEIISYVMAGVMRREDALVRLKLARINHQVAFCTERSLKTLKFLGSYTVEP